MLKNSSNQRLPLPPSCSCCRYICPLPLDEGHRELPRCELNDLAQRSPAQVSRHCNPQRRRPASFRCECLHLAVVTGASDLPEAKGGLAEAPGIKRTPRSAHSGGRSRAPCPCTRATGTRQDWAGLVERDDGSHGRVIPGLRGQQGDWSGAGDFATVD